MEPLEVGGARAVDDGDLARPVADEVDRVGLGDVEHLDVDVGGQRVEALQQVGEQLGGQAGPDRDRQPPQQSRAHRPHARGGRVEVGQQQRRAGHEVLPGGGGLDAAAVALEQRDPQLALELRDRAADSGGWVMCRCAAARVKDRSWTTAVR